MNKSVIPLAFTLLIGSASLLWADSYDDCLAECTKAQGECVAGITLYDQTGIDEAKQACAKELVVCKKKCHDIEDMGPEAYQQRQQQQEQQAEQKRQEQELQDNGNIKIYQAPQESDSIKTYQEPQDNGGIKTYRFND